MPQRVRAGRVEDRAGAGGGRGDGAEVEDLQHPGVPQVDVGGGGDLGQVFPPQPAARGPANSSGESKTPQTTCPARTGDV